MGAGSAAPAAGPRVWIDAQLPPALARWLAREQGVDAVHVDDAGFLGAGDPEIFRAARAGGAAAVVTKDDDFVRLLDQHGPPQVVWVRWGNVRNRVLRQRILPLWPQIAALLAAGEPLVEVG